MDGKTPGYLPSNYVKVLGLKRGQRQTPTPEVRPAPGEQSSSQAVEEEVSLLVLGSLFFFIETILCIRLFEETSRLPSVILVGLLTIGWYCVRD